MAIKINLLNSNAVFGLPSRFHGSWAPVLGVSEEVRGPGQKSGTSADHFPGTQGHRGRDREEGEECSELGGVGMPRVVTCWIHVCSELGRAFSSTVHVTCVGCKAVLLPCIAGTACKNWTQPLASSRETSVMKAVTLPPRVHFPCLAVELPGLLEPCVPHRTARFGGIRLVSTMGCRPKVDKRFCGDLQWP